MTALRSDALLSLRSTNIECEGTLPRPLLKKFRKRFFKESVTHSNKNKKNGVVGNLQKIPYA